MKYPYSIRISIGVSKKYRMVKLTISEVYGKVIYSIFSTLKLYRSILYWMASVWFIPSMTLRVHFISIEKFQTCIYFFLRPSKVIYYRVDPYFVSKWNSFVFTCENYHDIYMAFISINFPSKTTKSFMRRMMVRLYVIIIKCPKYLLSSKILPNGTLGTIGWYDSLYYAFIYLHPVILLQ